MIDFASILAQLGFDFGGSGEVFSMIFRISIEKCDFSKNSVFPRKNHYFQAFELSKIIQKTTKNRGRIASKLERENIGSKIAGKSNLERFGAPFGKGLGGSGASLGRLLAVFLRFGIELS